MMMISNAWNEIVLEVVRAASERISLRDFEMQCQLTPVTNGKSYYDRIRIAEELIADRVIEVTDGYLRLTKKDIPEWLVQGLKEGSEICWKIIEIIDPVNKLAEKFDRLLLEQIGYEGEIAVMNLLTAQLPKNVLGRLKHVSLTDDGAGFDIQSPSVRDSANTFFFEVKTTYRPCSEFHFFISKNEVRVASQNSNWRLLAVRHSSSGYEVIGTAPFECFSEYLPMNLSSRGRWEVVRISVPYEVFERGLP